MPDARMQKQEEEIQLVVFKLGEEELGVNIHQVREIVRLVPITPIPRAPEFIEGVVNLRGQVLAVMDLAKRLDIPSKPRSEKTRIVVVELEDNAVGMIVDEVSEVLRIPTSKVEKTPQLIESEISQRYITGVGKLKDRLLILIDLVAILSAEELEHVRKIEQRVSSEEKKETSQKEETKKE
ncbi:MAG: chemotaxis protein CheW [Candidatus Omnitrophica bacterium]|nr:chemotaxis protein CheW [Candidatus Omnitrophota bacterium]